MANSTTDTAKRLSMTASVLLVLTVTAACGGKSEQEDGWQSKQDVMTKVTKLRKSTELPPGGKWTADVTGSDDDRYQSGSADALVLDEAQCEWYAYWIDRTEASDQKASAAALKQFAVLHDMSAFKANDVSYRDLVQSIEDAAELGDPSGVQNFVRDNCGDMQEGSSYQ